MPALASLLDALAAAATITPEHALQVRRAIYENGVISPEEAELMLAVDERAAERAPEWRALFLEALTDFLVRQQQPTGYIDEANAAWLTSRIARDGVVRTDSELELLVRVLEAAVSAPRALTLFALEQVKHAVLHGAGPLAQGGEAAPGRITAGEVQLLRRVLFAAAGDDSIAVTRQEAELLFDLNDACRGQPNHPSWTDLFVRALAASVMAASGYASVSRDDALRRELWLAEGPDVGGFLSRMFARAPDAKGALAAITGQRDNPHAEQAARLAAAVKSAEPVDQAEAEWLAARIGKDGVFDAAERQLIQFLQRESPIIHPSLRPLLERAADSQAEGGRARFGTRGV